MQNEQEAKRRAAAGEDVLADRILGSLIGGAAGDALGYAVEFDSLSEIYRKHGPGGITRYSLHGGKAEVSDDTQMTLFTANGLLTAIAEAECPAYIDGIAAAYRDWLRTQEGGGPGKVSWLNDVPEMNSRRAPGLTCMSALRGSRLGSVVSPVNDSKGCGGIMRVAPVGLLLGAQAMPQGQIDMLGAEAAALTHGHALGYIPAAVLVHIVSRLAHEPDLTVLEAVRDAGKEVLALFPQTRDTDYLRELIDWAIALAEDAETPPAGAIRQLGQGWVGEEALAIAVYCALRFEDDFASATIAAVNHDGDSDSTGAVTGNILGARLGLRGIPEEWSEALELIDVIRRVARDLTAAARGEDGWQAACVRK